MKMALLRVGIDEGCGGMQGPLFADGGFEFLPIPDNKQVGSATYGNTLGARGEPLVTYFPKRKQALMHGQAMHDDPEFTTFTYGDPSTLKGRLRDLERGDILAFYAGLEGFDHACDPGLYLVGYFVVEWAGRATDLPETELRKRCGRNFHVAYESVFKSQRERLVLVQGGAGSRLLSRAVCISTNGVDKSGQPLKVLSPEAQRIFGDFDGRISIQRSAPRWVASQHVASARNWLLALP